MLWENLKHYTTLYFVYILHVVVCVGRGVICCTVVMTWHTAIHLQAYSQLVGYMKIPCRSFAIY